MSGLDVHTGFWYNYRAAGDDNSVFHWTLTVWALDGALLTAFLALFVTVTMGSLWPILCFIIHQFRSTSKPRPALYHQQQALLSNSPPTAATALALLQMGWSWRQAKMKGTWRKSIPLVVAALIFMGLSAAASLLSSRVQLESDEVLAKGSSCGYVGFGPTRSIDAESSLHEEDTVNRQTASSYWSRLTAFQCLEYVRYCYSSSTLDNSNLCKRYTKPTLPVTVDLKAECPFDDKICAQTEAIHVDTGLLNSNTDLGINTPAAERVWFRKLLTCAPIRADDEDYSTPWTSERIVNESDSDEGDAHPPGTQYKYYNLGPLSSTQNYTFEITNNSFASTDGLRRVYGLGSITSFYGFGEVARSTKFEPIPELNVSDSDITLLYLLNNARYISPVEDPWFRASNNGTRDLSGADRTPNPPYFMSDKAASTLACTEQYQFCSDPLTCSPLGGLNDNSTNPYLGLDLNESQKALFNLLVFCARSITITNAVDIIGSQILRANEMVWGGSGDLRSSVLPPNQWQEEILNFSYTMLAAVQGLMVGFAAPPNFPVYTLEGRVMSHKYLDPPTTREEGALCSKIRLRDARYRNFDVAGIVAILVIGCVVMFTNAFVLPGVVFWIQRKLRWNVHARREWLGGHLFMQQKAAFEAHGIGPWHVGSDGDVPWTTAVSQNKVVSAAEGDGPRPRVGRRTSNYEAIPLEGPKDAK